MLKHWIWLTRCKGIGCITAKKLIKKFGSAEVIYALTWEHCREAGLSPKVAEAVMNKDMGDIEQVIEQCARLRIRILTYGDSLYPERLRQIPDPPMVLYYKGTIPDVDREATIAVVGTRSCSNYGMVQAKQFSSLIALSGGIVVSGGARGIDTVALSSALSSIMPVICVLAGGLDDYYPRENTGLFHFICEHGCLISEYPPGTQPRSTNFLARNRLISGLSLGTLVVEAPRKSGSLTTASMALHQNRDVYTIHRPDMGERCMGNEDLIASGCEAVKDGWEIMARYAHLYPDRILDGRTDEAAKRLQEIRCNNKYIIYSPVLTEQRGYCNPEAPVNDTENTRYYGQASEFRLTEEEERIMNILGVEPLDMDTIIARSGMSPSETGMALTMLQLKKRIIKNFGNSYQRL
ncbi:MAG: DNA-processing protein DprA [Oscillospiraceae bacterium]|nr:DNA-processing protein DprA [Oscillospiraceae bacterium]